MPPVNVYKYFSNIKNLVGLALECRTTRHNMCSVIFEEMESDRGNKCKRGAHLVRKPLRQNSNFIPGRRIICMFYFSGIREIAVCSIHLIKLELAWTDYTSIHN